MIATSAAVLPPVSAFGTQPQPPLQARPVGEEPPMRLSPAGKPTVRRGAGTLVALCEAEEMLSAPWTALDSVGRSATYTTERLSILHGSVIEIVRMDLSSGVTTRARVGKMGERPTFAGAALSADGTHAAYYAADPDWEEGFAFWEDCELTVVDLVTREQQEIDPELLGYEGCFFGSVGISADASKLVASVGPKADYRVGPGLVLLDRAAGTSRVVSVEGCVRTMHPALTPDGRHLALVGVRDGPPREPMGLAVFCVDLETCASERVSRAVWSAWGNGPIETPSISDDGQRVAFTAKLGEAFVDAVPDKSHALLVDRAAGWTRHLCATAASGDGICGSMLVALSGDGRYASFSERLDGLEVSGICLAEVDGDALLLPPMPEVSEDGAWFAHDPAVSHDGRAVLFRAVYRTASGEWDMETHNVFLWRPFYE